MEEDIKKRIEQRAYEIWQFRQQHGMIYTVDRLGNIREINQLDDWLEAQAEILGELFLRK